MIIRKVAMFLLYSVNLSGQEMEGQLMLSLTSKPYPSLSEVKGMLSKLKYVKCSGTTFSEMDICISAPFRAVCVRNVAYTTFTNTTYSTQRTVQYIRIHHMMDWECRPCTKSKQHDLRVHSMHYKYTAGFESSKHAHCTESTQHDLRVHSMHWEYTTCTESTQHA